VLGARADRGHHLVWIGRGEYEHDVGRRFFQRLQERGGGGLGELVNLVEDVDLPASGRSVPGSRGDVANVIDTVVGRGVELGDVERRTLVIATQLAQTLQASPSSGFSQLSAFARIRAVVVFPVPRGPEKRYACETRWFFTAPCRARTTWS